MMLNTRQYQCRTFKHSQNGQAMLEFMIAMLVLAPIFFMIPILGKYIDIKMATVSAARYEAWERTVAYPTNTNWGQHTKTQAVLRQEVVDNFYTQPQAQKQWNDNKAKALLLPFNPNATATTSNSSDSSLAVASNAGLTALLAGLTAVNTVGNLGGGAKFDPNRSALFVAKVKVIGGPMPDLSLGVMGNTANPTTGNISFGDAAGSVAGYGTSVILADAWGASGSDNGNGSVKTQVSGLVPTTTTAAKVTMVSFATLQGEFSPSSAIPGYLSPGKINPDLIPPDRR
jgi:hypothetical protein